MTESKRTVAWFDSDAFDWHEGSTNHPERPARLQAIRKRFQNSGLAQKLLKQPCPEVERSLLEEVHTAEYVEKLDRLTHFGATQLDADTYCSEGSWEAALRAAGAMQAAVKGVVEGRFQRAFCGVRPPGHHARPGAAMGFCLFGNVAVGAQAALKSPLIERVAILDWDVHHGNGTEEIFLERADVFYASLHQYPAYPATGDALERGHGEGEGYNLNVPLAPGSGDAEFLAGWREHIRPALTEYKPQILLISAGFDADFRDPLGDLNVTTAGFRALSQEVMNWADENCAGRVVSVLEGGYDCEALAEDVEAHVETMLSWSALCREGEA